MSKQHTDLTFFTNGPQQTLLDRFKATEGILWPMKEPFPLEI